MADKSLSYCELECTKSSEFCFQVFLISRPALVRHTVLVLLPPVKQKMVFKVLVKSVYVYIHISHVEIEICCYFLQTVNEKYM